MEGLIICKSETDKIKSLAHNKHCYLSKKVNIKSDVGFRLTLLQSFCFMFFLW